ncbi:MAG: hypothetical protein LAT55_13030, partial [Opitutales bacterium]|nr:hypothetical protein [Opitutales bacterium]
MDRQHMPWAEITHGHPRIAMNCHGAAAPASSTPSKTCHQLPISNHTSQSYSLIIESVDALMLRNTTHEETEMARKNTKTQT